MKKIIFCTMTLLAAIVLSGCKSSKKIVYFQDVDSLKNVVTTIDPVDVRIQPGDRLSILVKAQGGTEINEMFSMSQSGWYSGVADNATYGYAVKPTGDIDFPVIGKVQVAGLTRSEVEKLMKQKILSSGQAKSVVVNVSFLNLTYSVMGEVNSPGRYTVSKDHVTILDAIAEARDLTIYGKRKNVMLLRQEGDHQQVYRVDLTKSEKLMTSPAYYIRQNDIIYVEPNKAKVQNTEIGNMTSLYFSMASIGFSLASLLFNILK